MTREELTEMIRGEIQQLAFETLRSGSAEKKEKKKAFKPKGLTEDELEYALFYGGNEPNKDGSVNTSKFIKENFDSGIPKINSSDITQFEEGFEKVLQEIDGASVVFDQQSNGYSLKMWIGREGIEAGASGTIEMGNKGRLKWAYSLQNGLTVSTEDLAIEKGNKLIIEKLYNNYDSWQKDWREKLTVKPGQGAPDAAPEESVEAAPDAAAAGEAAPEIGGAGELPV
jgi:hypothetical protein